MSPNPYKSALVLLCALSLYFQASSQTFTSVSSGIWEDGATWGNNSPGTSGVDYPSNNDDVVISSGTVVTQSEAFTIADLSISLTGELQTNATLRVRGSYNCDGLHSGTGQVRLQNGSDIISGSGIISTTGLFRVNNGRMIEVGSNLTRQNGNLRCPNNDTLINNGTLRLEDVNLAGNASGSFRNASNGTLFASRSVLNNGTLIASDVGNTIIYSRTGNGNQNVKVAIDGYYNLQFIGTTTSSKRNVNADFEVLNDLTINGPEMRFNGAFNVQIGGDLVMMSGSLDPGTGSIEMNGTGSQSISGDFSLNDLTINSSSTTSITSDSCRIQGTLAVTAGTLNTGGRLIINSNASGDGSIASLGGSISGNVVVERYIAPGPADWRFLTSPVNGTTVQDWQQSFITSGFPGSSFPSFPFVSVYNYDETVAGNQGIGYTAPSNASNSLGMGRGYYVWCSDNNNSGAAFTIRVTGPVNSGSVSLPVSFTSQSGITEDGWCLVGNPYASVIDWNSNAWSKTNIDDAVYVWNAQLDLFSSFVNGSAMNGGSNLIASGQAFFVKANAANPSLSIDQGAKSSSSAGFLRPQTLQPELIFRLVQSELKVESAIRLLPEATNGFDPRLDAHFLSGPNSPMKLFTVHQEQAYSINSVTADTRQEIVLSHLANRGKVKLEYELTASTNAYCIVLNDLHTGETYVLDQDGFIEFDNKDTLTHTRFSVGIHPLNNASSASPCDLPTGMEDSPSAQASLQAYSLNNRIMLAGSDASDVSAYALHALNGTLVESGTVQNGELRKAFDVAAGIYLLELETSKGSRHFKIAFE